MTDLPEAPASATITAYKRGYKVLVTMRDEEVKEVLTKVDWVIKLFENQPDVKPWYEEKDTTSKPKIDKPSVEEPIPENWCPIHQVEMTKYSKEGRSWYSHRLDDGTWCKGK